MYKHIVYAYEVKCRKEALFRSESSRVKLALEMFLICIFYGTCGNHRTR